MSSTRDAYREVIFALLGAAGVASIASAYAGMTLGNPVLLDGSISLGIAAAMLGGAAAARSARVRGANEAPSPSPEVLEGPFVDGPIESAPGASSVAVVAVPATVAAPPKVASANLFVLLWQRIQRAAGSNATDLRRLRAAIGAVGVLASGFVLFLDFRAVQIEPVLFTTVTAAYVVAAFLTDIAVRYLVTIESSVNELKGITRGGRVVMWILVLCAASVGCEWIFQLAALQAIHLAVFVINIAVCGSLLATDASDGHSFPVDVGVLSILGSRTNMIASVLDAGERQLGIDLRSTWALTVVRTTIEPLVIGLCVVGWLSTSLTVVGLDEEGLVERLGVSVQGELLMPGLHLHWPWPVDRVIRVPVRRVQLLTVGHESQENEGPEDVLWARAHAANEFTLLLGNGRDLITIDAAVQFRIADARAWRYQTQNPADALRAIAYRAVMRNTVNRTLADALSENVIATTARMRRMVQQDADALGLGVEVLGFTVGGMHPPVPVAADYQAVISAELGKVTAVVNANAYRNRTVPAAETSVITQQNAARAAGAQALARAAGEAWAFLTLQSQYRASPQEFFFRRRLETLEKSLTGRHFTVVDSRIQRDGGELWVNP